jgi:hypothetical protein
MFFNTHKHDVVLTFQGVFVMASLGGQIFLVLITSMLVGFCAVLYWANKRTGKDFPSNN